MRLDRIGAPDSRAADELETYLKLVPKAQETEKVRQTIKELRSRL